MIIPNVLRDKNPPSNEEIIAKLMESIAEEEIALAHILSSEADKINAFVGKNLDFPTLPSNKEIIAFNQSTHRIIESVLMKEWLLLKKLETVISLKEKMEYGKHFHQEKECNEKYEEESCEDSCKESSSIEESSDQSCEESSSSQESSDVLCEESSSSQETSGIFFKKNVKRKIDPLGEER